MHQVIDTPWTVTAHLGTIRTGGTDTIIRYLNHQNSSALPEKRIEKAEADAIANEGLSLCVVFQQRGGASGNIGDLDEGGGISDGKRALELAERIRQPEGSAIYFAVDYDFYRPSDLSSIKDYFAAISAQFNGKFRIGVYGSGLVGKTVRDAGHAELIWLAAATGWSGTRQLLTTDAWALFQKWPLVSTPFPHDGNTISPAWPDYGQFIPGSANVAAAGLPTPRNTVLMEVVARRGLNLRRGAGEHYAVEQTLPQGIIVHALAQHGDWVQVDLDGDAQADGHVHGAYLAPVSGGFPVQLPIAASPPTPPKPPSPAVVARGGLLSPFDIALAELALDVREVPGTGNNPRIVMYHNSTNAWCGTDDAVAWCSSFINYCVEQAGRIGTSSQRALDWENWGHEVTETPKEGDIAVFERVGKGGHVAFFVKDFGDDLSVLGGNQSNRVRISTYPKYGVVNGTRYNLRSIRRC